MPIKYRKPHIPDFRRVTRVVTEVANDVLNAEVETFADDEAQRFTRDIERQVFPSFKNHPLKRTYFKRKKQQGLDKRIMIATGWYKDHIKVWHWRPPGSNPRTTSGLRIGFHPRVQARDVDGNVVPITLNKLARVHEHGSLDQTIPPRPHWQPHLTAMTKRAAAVRVRIQRNIMRTLKKKLARFA